MHCLLIELTTFGAANESQRNKTVDEIKSNMYEALGFRERNSILSCKTLE
jgi:hypothetical protein